MLDFFIAFIKEKSPTFFAVILIFTGCLLYIPETAKIHLGLDKFIIEYNLWIGAAFLFSIAFLLVTSIVMASKFIKSKITLRGKKKNAKLHQQSYMENLTNEEVLYLVPYLVGLNSLHLLEEDGVRGGLVAKDILYRSANVGSMLSGFAYNMQPWALKYLKENPDIYERHVGRIGGLEDIERLYRNGKPWEKSRW